MNLTDSRQGYGWISIAFHWVVAIATFYLLYNGLTLQEGEGDRGEFVRGAGGRPFGDAGQRFAEGARQFGEGFANAGRQLAENIFAPRSLHISIGVIAIVLIVARIVWRVVQGSQPKANDSRALNIVAAIVQWGLLAALLMLAVTGPLLIWGMGQPIQVFNWFAIPSPLPAMRNLHEMFQTTHTIAAYAIFPLVGLHVLGALKHALIDRDATVRRMLVARRA
jgi:cytochrome b561